MEMIQLQGYKLSFALNVECYLVKKVFGTCSMIKYQDKAFVDRRHKGNMTKLFACLGKERVPGVMSAPSASNT